MPPNAFHPMQAPAVFLGIQPGFMHLPPIELYNLLAPVGEIPAGSTMSRQTLERLGYELDHAPGIRSHRSRAENFEHTMLPTV